MIKLKELRNRVYSGKECIYFEYDIVIDDQVSLPIQFIKKQNSTIQENANEWKTRIIIDRTRDKDSDVYSFSFVMPRNGLPLELIAATGLRFFQLYLKEEIQNKAKLDFALGEVIRGM